ncbi:hypothetical protein PFISCL1PPCAC_2899, partial [Pristionchus fissidentatus]
HRSTLPFSSISQMLLFLLLLAFTVNPVEAGTRAVQMSGRLFCMDENYESRPMPYGRVHLMEYDWDPNDLIEESFLKTDATYYVSGEHWEFNDPEFFLKFVVPCPPPAHCVDKVWKDRCEKKRKAEFTYFVERNAASPNNWPAVHTYYVRCDLGVKNDTWTPKDPKTIDGLSCIGGLTKGRAVVEV